jgi:hypothetical protein
MSVDSLAFSKLLLAPTCICRELFSCPSKVPAAADPWTSSDPAAAPVAPAVAPAAAPVAPAATAATAADLAAVGAAALGLPSFKHMPQHTIDTFLA